MNFSREIQNRYWFLYSSMEKFITTLSIPRRLVAAVTIFAMMVVYLAPLSAVGAAPSLPASLSIVTLNGSTDTSHCVAGDLTYVVSGLTGPQGGGYSVDVGDGYSTTTTADIASGQNVAFNNVTLDPFTPTQGSNVILIYFYHGQPTGNDSNLTVVNQCVAAPTEGVLIVKKHVDASNGGSAVAGDFQLSVTGQSPFPGSETGTDFTLPPSTYTVSETLAIGYQQDGISCLGDDSTSTTNGSVNVTAGHNYVCTVTNTYNPVNVAPILTPIGAKSVAEGDTLTINLTASDDNLPSGTLTYSATGLPSGSTLVENNFSWTPGYTDAGIDPVVTFKVSDSALDDSEAVTITVTNTNRIPSFNATTTQSVAEGSVLTYTVSATDPDGGTLTYSLSGQPTGMTINTANGEISWTPSETQGPGTYYVTVTVTDGSVSVSTVVQVDVTEVNNFAPTTIDINDSTHINIVKIVTLSGSDNDVPAGTLAFSIVGAPTNGTLGTVSGNSVTYTPATNFTGTDTFTYKANDGQDSNTSTVTINVDNGAPVLNPIVVAPVPEGSIVAVTPVATDPDGDTLTFSIANHPSGSSFVTSTGVLTWGTGENDGPSTHTGIVIVASDGTFSASQTFDITITEVNVNPTADAKTATTNEDTPVSVTLSGADTDVPVQTLTYAVASGPTNGSVSVIGDQVTYTPNADWNGSDSFTYSSSDGVSSSAPATVSITVDPINDAPMISLIGSSTVSLLIGDTFTDHGATSTDAEEGNLTSSIVTSGTVSTSTAGTYVLTYSVTDFGGLGATTTRTVIVSNTIDMTPPVITLNGSATMNLDVSGQYNEPGATAVDNVDGNLTSSIVMTGHPNMGNPGTYTITYTVTDSSGNTATAARTINVSHAATGGGGGGGGNGSPYTFGYVSPIQGGGSGGRLGEVLGAEISAGELATCLNEQPYLTSYLKRGTNNDKNQVAKLQTFLNEMMGSNLPITGYFGPLTFRAVMDFQVANKEQVLIPWVVAKAAKDDSPSGYVYKTTKRWINILKCKDLEAITPMPQLP